MRQTDVEIGEMERRRQVAANGNTQVRQPEPSMPARSPGCWSAYQRATATCEMIAPYRVACRRT